MIFEVLATDDLAQAEARAGGAHGNKGWEAAEAAPRDGVARSSCRGRRGDEDATGGRPMIVDKPWGKVATYALNQPSSVRVITVEPGQETSVHYHRMRDEMWVVLDPGLTIEIGNRVVEAQPGEEFMVPAEETHRIRNRGTVRAASSRSPTATPPRTTPSGWRTPTAARWSPTGERATCDPSTRLAARHLYSLRRTCTHVCSPCTGASGACSS